MDAASSTSGRGAVISVAAKRERCGSSVDEESHCSLLSDDEESHGKEDGGGADGRGRNKRAKQVSSATLDALRQALPEPIKKVTGKGGKNTNLSYTLHSKMFHGIGAAAEHASKCIVCPLEVRRAAVKYLLIRARQSLKRNGGLRSVEEIVGYRHDDVAVAVASSSRAPPSPFQVLRDFSKLSEIEERWLDDYTAMCDEAERAVARGVCRARRQAAVMDGFDDGDDEEQPRDLDTARAIIDEGVHGPVEEPSTNGRPKRRAAQALQAYLRAGAANGML
jgi:hypothetical protein